LLQKQYLSFPPKWESSFFALDPCFLSGDIVGFCFLQQILNSRITAKMPEYLLAFEENTILEPLKPVSAWLSQDGREPIAQAPQI